MLDGQAGHQRERLPFVTGPVKVIASFDDEGIWMGPSSRHRRRETDELPISQRMASRPFGAGGRVCGVAPGLGAAVLEALALEGCRLFLIESSFDEHYLSGAAPDALMDPTQGCDRAIGSALGRVSGHTPPATMPRLTGSRNPQLFGDICG